MLAPAVGIYIGTYHSSVGVWTNNEFNVIPDREGNKLISNCVRVFNNKICICNECSYIHENDPELLGCGPTLDYIDLCPKTIIGKSSSDLTIKEYSKYFPFDIVKSDNGILKVKIESLEECSSFYPEQLLSIILCKLKLIAEDYLCKEVIDVVISVPSVFNNTQRQSVLNCGPIIGLNIIRIVNEAISASLAYGINCNPSSATNDEVYEVKAVRGDSSCGGFEFCKQMIEHCVKEIYTQLEMDISNNKQALRNLNSKCHKALINTVDSN